ncbi:uncharacterized protein LOC144659188 [Oculina patagonica]
MAENVTEKLDCIMKSLEKLSLIESRLDSMASTMANIESTLSRLDADVTVLKDDAEKRDKKISEVETSINYTEEDVADLQKDLHDHKAQLDKCKKDLLYLEAYSRRENVKIFGVPENTTDEKASEPEDTKNIVFNFLENELQIENPRGKYEFQRVHRLGKPNSTLSRPIIIRFLRYTDKEDVMRAARIKLKDKDFFMYDDIPKDLYDLRKQQQKKFKQARDKGFRVHFSKAHPDQLFVNGKFLPPDQPLE